ncbi:glycosyltransferase 87 family protein [Cohnella thermotolerans]|uniref:glycosyltransferase 87 family protein n=1 Tax=Cohnella thermotolerans TaxID=329858 RepID=UPI000420AF6D|nr:glycosyltransferase 87 family protein [Cohnella thermotolerans]
MESIVKERLNKSKFAVCASILIAAACVLHLFAAERWAGFLSDQRLFVQWWQSIQQFGLGGAYAQNGSINYPPFFLLLMDGYGRILKLFGLTPHAGELSFKTILLFIDLLSMLLAVRLTAGMRSWGWRLAVLALFAFNPALIADGPVWGQVDLLHGMLMVLAIASVPKRPWLSGLVMALAVLTKFQAVTVVPIIGIYLLAERVRTRRWQPALQWLAAFLVPWLVTAAYFGAAGGLGAMIRQAYTDAVGKYTSVTMNAMNVWFHITGISPATADTTKIMGVVTYRALGLMTFAAAAAFVCVYVVLATRRRLPAEAVLFKAAASINLAFFMLPTEIHERYGIPALLFVLFAVVHDRRWLAPAAALTVTTFVNLLVVLQRSGGRQGFGRSGPGGNRTGGMGRFGWGGMTRPGSAMTGNGMTGNGMSGNGMSGNGMTGNGGFHGGNFGSVSPGGGTFGGIRGFGGFGSGRGSGSALSAAYAWIAIVNVAVLLLLFWLLWREIRPSRGASSSAAEEARQKETASSPSQ